MFRKAFKRESFPAALCAAALGFFLPVCAAAGVEDGVAAIAAGNYVEAFRIVEARAKKGDARAQYLLGSLYRSGKGAPKDEYRAFHWCKRAADEGHLEAQFQVGVMYLHGEGVTASDEEAMKWLWQAADRGYAQATELLEYVLYNDVSYGC